MIIETENYVSLSDAIQTEKTKIFDSLGVLHNDLCHLSKLEQDLKTERMKGVTYIKGLVQNVPELIEHLNAHNKQLGIPTQKVWSLIDSAIALIDQHNRSLMNGSVDQLPEVFNKSNRLQEFQTGKE